MSDMNTAARSAASIGASETRRDCSVSSCANQAMENLDDAREVLDSLVARMSELEERNLLEDFLFQDVAKAFRCVYMARMNLGSAIEGLEQSGAAQ